MDRVPPNLLYLTIYNPSLRSTNPASNDDEDAEEQAHILFYTSSERAVSRDRMLRQVGLAKALINFSEMFNLEEPCNNVHSQSRRMIMISPEPNFWIHAGIELSKTPRASADKGKGKEKEKERSKAPEKGAENEKDHPTGYDYYDASVHDLALRSDILRGYEQFKLTHGSFTSILSTLGQQALELQLERFFTVWAWSWNLEGGHEFGEHLGVPLHPLYRHLVPFLDSLSSQIPDHASPIIISPPYIVPSARFTDAKYPPSLSRYLLSLAPPPRESVQNSSDQGSSSSQAAQRTLKATLPPEPTPDATPRGTDVMKGNGASESGSNTFLGMPTMNINMNMDVRKWNWPGYLTFGKGSGKRPHDRGLDEERRRVTSEDKGETKLEQHIKISDDGNGLEHTISPDDISKSEPSGIDGQPADAPLPGEVKQSSGDGTVDLNGRNMFGPLPVAETMSEEPQTTSPTLSHIHPPPTSDTASLLPVPPISVTVKEVPPPAESAPEFSSVFVHLPDVLDSSITRRRKVFYLTRQHVIVALVGLGGDHENFESSELRSLADKVMIPFGDIMNVMKDEELKSSTDLLPSATKILQPNDRHILSTTHFTLSSPGFMSKSGHMYDAQQLQENDSNISEVFSRGQNPQHWHVARSGLGVNADGIKIDGEVYMEVFRKETSLTDVDNALAGVVRRFAS